MKKRPEQSESPIRTTHIEISQDLSNLRMVLPPFQIIRHFDFSMYVDTKATYLEKPKRLIIWNGLSTF